MSRCFIVDPVCAMTFGHSLNSLKYFSDLSQQFYTDVTILASKHLPNIPGTAHIARYFNFYYFNIFDISQTKNPPPNPEIRSFQDNRLVAAYDFSKMFIEYNIGDDDSIFLPSADFYSIVGLVSALSRFKGRRSPKILLRLIGVMENAVVTGQGRINECFQQLLLAVSSGANIHISAETPKYASYLQDMLQMPVQTTPYPAFDTTILPPSANDKLTVLCGGSGRLDKGFYRLLNIIELCNKTGAPVDFIIQNIPDKDQISNLSYINKLYAIPNVELLPGSISYSEIVDSYRACHVTMMPYDRPTYEYRGSAMLMESILFGRQSIGQSGTGFAEQIESYGAGECADTDQEFADKILKFIRSERPHIYDQAEIAREVYINDVTERYMNWMGN